MLKEFQILLLTQHVLSRIFLIPIIHIISSKKPPQKQFEIKRFAAHNLVKDSAMYANRSNDLFRLDHVVHSIFSV